MTHRVGVIGGDGIGPEVVAEALKVVRAAAVPVETVDYDLGGARYLRTGEVLPDTVLDELRGVDAILLGAWSCRRRWRRPAPPSHPHRPGTPRRRAAPARPAARSGLLRRRRVPRAPVSPGDADFRDPIWTSGSSPARIVRT